MRDMPKDAGVIARQFNHWYTRLLAALTILILAALLILLTFCDRQQQSRIECQMQQLDALVRMLIDDTEKLLYPLAVSIAGDPSVRKILEAGFRHIELGDAEAEQASRDALYSLLEVRWQEMRNVVELRQVHFLTADGISFLRMHEPSRHGDGLVSVRPLIRRALATGQPQTGYEVGRLYGGVRVILPIRGADERLRGLVEVGLSMGPILEPLTREMGMLSALLFPQQLVDSIPERPPFLVPMRINGDDVYLDTCASSSELASILGTANLTQADFQSSQPQWRRVASGKREWLLFLLPFRGAVIGQSDQQTGAQVGQLLIWRDYSDAAKDQARCRQKILLLALLLWLGMAILVYYGLKRGTSFLQSRVDAQTREIRTLADSLQEQAMTDPLTAVRNRRYLIRRLQEQQSRYERRREVASVIMLDVDHFKQINDRYGHICGDQVLIALARQLEKAMRPTDILARYGGEEFCILLPMTDLDEAKVLAERLRQQVAKLAIACPKVGERIQITISLGIATWRSGDSGQDIIRRADEALYRAKQKGRDRVEIESGSPRSSSEF